MGARPCKKRAQRLARGITRKRERTWPEYAKSSTTPCGTSRRFRNRGIHGVLRWGMHELHGASVPDPKFVNKFPAGASRLAAWLLAQIRPVSSLVAPCDPGAAPGTLPTNFGFGTLVSRN